MSEEGFGPVQSREENLAASSSVSFGARSCFNLEDLQTAGDFPAIRGECKIHVTSHSADII